MASCCCTGDGSAALTVAAPVWRRRVVSIIQWMLPAAMLAIIPKCPACVAGYVLLFTGLGLSLPAAAAVRWTLIGVCACALLFLAVRGLRNALHMWRGP